MSVLLPLVFNTDNSHNSTQTQTDNKVFLLSQYCLSMFLRTPSCERSFFFD